MLEQKAGHQRRECEPALIVSGRQNDASESDYSCISFDGSLDVPLPVELVQPVGNLVAMFGEKKATFARIVRSMRRLSLSDERRGTRFRVVVIYRLRALF